ncbi:MAG TPA: polyprenyl diphosphate synthase [Patescibacteria group bacterium]|nr:polyprenyl diphosphate synthase [Patescibacteria group bacterium]
MSQAKTTSIKHIAIIMDGNRRWARTKGLGAINGHEHVVNNVIEPLVDRCIELGIPYLTLWAFSTENWDRDKNEIEGVMQLFRRAFERKVEDLHKKGVRLNILGEIERFPKDIVTQAKRWTEVSKGNTKITLNIALNYGGRDEIVRAVNRAMQSTNNKITVEDIQQNLDTAGLPDPDIIIRPGGELRLSGFMLWQSAYSELYFTEVLMPDFTTAELDKAIEDFKQRRRRFGK